MSHQFKVCDIVYYGLDSFGQKRQQWRVNCHYRKVYWEPTPKPINGRVVDKVVWDILDYKILTEWYGRLEKKLPANRRFSYRACRPEEATHLGLVAVCGAIAPIDKCEFIKVVEWEPNFIREEQEFALRLIDGSHIVDWQWE